MGGWQRIRAQRLLARLYALFPKGISSKRNGVGSIRRSHEGTSGVSYGAAKSKLYTTQTGLLGSLPQALCMSQQLPSLARSNLFPLIWTAGLPTFSRPSSI